MLLNPQPSQRKRFLIVTSAALFIAVSGSGRSSAETYTFDKTSTEVRFTYQLGLMAQSARFTDVEGLVEFNERTPEGSRVDAVINAASLTASEPLVENELKGKSFFNVALQPKIRFKSHTVKSTAKESAELTGELTLNGITQPVRLQVQFLRNGQAAARGQHGPQLANAGPLFTATGRIKRSSFNMTAYGMLVADDIEIQIAAPLRKK